MEFMVDLLFLGVSPLWFDSLTWKGMQAHQCRPDSRGRVDVSAGNPMAWKPSARVDVQRVTQILCLHTPYCLC